MVRISWWRWMALGLGLAGLGGCGTVADELFNQPLGLPVDNFQAQFYDDRGEISDERVAQYGAFENDGIFEFHDDEAADAFYLAMQDALCYRQLDNGKLAWKARISPTDQKLTDMVITYFGWYEKKHPEDETWGLPLCPEETEFDEETLAEYGSFLRDERFLFHRVADAEAFWRHLGEQDYACHRNNTVVTLVNPGARLGLVVTALSYWARAGLIHLEGGECVDWRNVGTRSATSAFAE